MQGQYLIIGSATIIAMVIVIIILHFIRKFEMKYYRDRIKELERQRNIVASTPVLLELSKVEPIIKNDKMEEKYNKWQDEFVSIKENRLTVIDDMLIDLDLYIEKRDYKSCGYSMAKIEMEIYTIDNVLHLTYKRFVYKSLLLLALFQSKKLHGHQFFYYVFFLKNNIIKQSQ